jgi:asparagine synthase (glutamine-hydrolysing)
MSGILGIFNLDGAPVGKPDLQRMAALLERRGPDGTRLWRAGTAGRGKRM